MLGECARLGLAATGVEINPAAVLLARLYEWANVERGARSEPLVRAAALLGAQIASEPPIASGLLSATHLRPQDIAALARSASADSVRRLIEAALILADPQWSEVSVARLMEAQRRLRDFVTGLPYSEAPIRVYQADARQVPLAEGSVDIVLTSPPYINVFNYHQQYRPAVEALDHDVLDAARSEIGSNRKHRMNRFLTVIQYAIDMAAVLDEMKRMLREGGRLIVVVGRESSVRGARILNGSLLGSVAITSNGLRPLMRQERSFRNRFGETIIEDILHFERCGPAEDIPRSLTVDIARLMLEQLVPTTSGEVQSDIIAAIEAASSVKASPLLDP
ncbi:MAG: methylase domain protein [Gemmatimonadetes bacterium]|nr:methylase domain protein [Gemmatimonadota bacterium]